jgi:hypothetical protein
MKMMVKLAVLFATLLLLTGVSFAYDCGTYCYEVTVTDLDDPTNTHTGCIGINFCNNEIMSPFGTDIVMFFDSMKEQVLIYDDSDPSCVGYVKFHGDDLHILKGIGYCEGERHNISGRQKDCCG